MTAIHGWLALRWPLVNFLIRYPFGLPHQASKQTSKQANKQASKQTNKQATKQTNKQASKISNPAQLIAYGGAFPN